MEILSKAYQLASCVHEGQVDKAGKPYFDHPCRVAGHVKGIDAKTVALLHDVIEDSPYTELALRPEFPKEIVDAVVALSRAKGEHYRIYINRVKANKLARAVKEADLMDNLAPSRLLALDKETQERLKAKYIPALRALAC